MISTYLSQLIKSFLEKVNIVESWKCTEKHKEQNKMGHL